MNLEALINQYYKNLNSNDMIVLNYVMQHKKECTNMNISRLSSECSISTASIVRTMKKLGFSGYSEFKFLLKGQNPGNMPTEGSNLIELLEKDIQATMKLMKQVDLNPILTLLYNAKRIYGFGIGFRQQNALQDFAHNMVSSYSSLPIAGISKTTLKVYTPSSCLISRLYPLLTLIKMICPPLPPIICITSQHH